MQKSLASQIVIPPQSPSAIPIVAPTEGSNASTPEAKPSPNKPVSKGSAKRLCRNVIIHGFCKYEGKGCEFNHESSNNSATAAAAAANNNNNNSNNNNTTTTNANGTNNGKPTPQGSPENNSTIRIQSPRSNSGMVSSVSAESVNAPVFVPKSVVVTPETATSSNDDNGLSNDSQLDNYLDEGVESLDKKFGQVVLHKHEESVGSPQQPQQEQPQQPQPQQAQPQSPAASHMMTMMQPDAYYYMGTPMFTRQPLQYHLYTSGLVPVADPLPHQRAIQSFFMPDKLRESLTQRNEATLLSAPARELGLPQEVHVYHSLYPLEEQNSQNSQFFGHSSRVYKAVSSVDGCTYTLVRIEAFRLINELAMASVEYWRRIRHCNIVPILEAFTTQAFGDSSLVFVYDYHPCASTLQSLYFTPQGQAMMQAELQAAGINSVLIPETTLWSYITQIASAIKTAHGSGLAVRSIEPSKILMTGKHRVRIGCVAMLDVLQFEKEHNIALQQQADLLAFGKLIVSLACNSPQSIHSLPQSVELISRYYSPDLKDVVLYLLSEPMATKTVDEVIRMIGPRILHEINSSQSYADGLESELRRELENGRLVRLLSKMGFINERPEFDMDPSWSETGDRYIIKLFRDYVFHQVDENGLPVVNMVHVLSCLNKLDAGVDEKIVLMSRDEESCLIVSYKEVKNCILSAFKDLTSGRK
ncbi:hypothetical protein BDB00DRAFT_828120 [Zychaea mexicana]|uniref:uncharacterized protein n=1 Tax=Zychaea mexicana TaxID=64656 RepID=UPI0022FDC231|nr:uncharacterized protein BDB00DRAFT_828120 [Zychaea mexicana]KAI9492444.1 hypothetical protein BDB00DRAFT_828120 [Zychaea mexicana]